MNSAMVTARGLYKFWHGFGVPAYPENYVPDDAVMPYITYDLKKPDWRGSISYNARVWYIDTSFGGIMTKIDEIADEIGDTGVRIEDEDGVIFLFKDNPFFQFQPLDEPDEKVKCAYLSMIIHVLA